MTKREMLLKKLSTYQFAVLDLQLFLDSHPNDSATLEKMNLYKLKAEKIKQEYEEEFEPLQKTVTQGNNWSWITGPWPWESEENN